MFSNSSKQHLEEAGMTRWQHFKHAVSIAFHMEMAACAVFIHAFFPRWFKKYATNTCKKIVTENNI
jgi:hypothetical protein